MFYNVYGLVTQNVKHTPSFSYKVRTLVQILGKFLEIVGKPIFRGIITIALLIRKVKDIKNLKRINKILHTSVKQIKKYFYTSLKQTIKWSKKKNVKKNKYQKKSRLSVLVNISLYLLFIIFSISISISYLFYIIIIKELPSPESLAQRPQEISTKIYDRNGKLLYTLYEDKNRTPIPLSEIPISVQLATIAAEDSEFYEHYGFSLKGITRAIIKNIKEDKLTSGSTITQQLVKNTLLTSDKTIIRKLKEITLSIQIESKFSKYEILEMYLNEVGYGSVVYGIQEASKYYFDKNVGELSVAEAAFLAGLPKSPTHYSPFGENKSQAVDRQKFVLNLMKENGFLNESQYNDAINDKLGFKQNPISIKAPHFVMFVRSEINEILGKENIYTSGLEITTTLDLSIQELAENTVREEIESLKKLNVTNAAAVVLDAKTGEILAMVGSVDYFNTENDGNVNASLSLRQPGSSIKVINYANALSKSHTLSSIIDDSPVTFKIKGQPDYTPRNYDGNFRGKISVRSALAESRNVPAVKVLSSYEIKDMMETAKKMGITTWHDPSNYGLSLTLGGGEIKLLDMARVYATLANYGQKPPITYIKKIRDQNGISATICDFKNNISDNDYCNSEEVIDERIAYLITDVLKDNNARSPAFGSNSLLNIKDHPEVAVKTGTSNDLRDNLAIGYNQGYVVAVWVGNNDNTPMNRVASGITGATPIFNKIMTTLLSGHEAKDWEVPNGLVKIATCPYTGTLACSGCPTKSEWFLEEKTPKIACNPEWFEEKDKDSNLASNRNRERFSN